MACFEGKTVRADQVLEVHPAANGRRLVKGEILLLTGTKEIMEDAEPVMVGEGPGPAVHPPKALGEVGVHPPEIGASLLDIPLSDGEGNILFLHQVVAFCDLLGQDAVAFLPIVVQAVSAFFH